MTGKVRRPASAPPIEDISGAKEHVNLGLYSYPGEGKTVWAASHPKALILATDTGTISAGRFGSKAKMWRIHDWLEFEKAQKWVRAGGHREYEWIVLDSFTMLREKLMRHILETEHARNASRDEFVPAQPDHQKVQNVMKRVAETFCSLPVHFLFTAHVQHVESRDGEAVALPMIHGQNGDTAQYIVGLVDALGYLTVDDEGPKEVRRIHWKRYGEYVAKSRFEGLRPYTEDKDLLQVQSLIENPREVRRGGTPTRRRRATTTRRSA